MQELLEHVFKIENVATMIAVLGCFGLGWLHVVWRREERADRAAMLDLVVKNTAAIEALKNVLSARMGQPL
jgi:hypothetical protein